MVRERLDDFDSTASGQAIADYVEELSNWYVRLSRRRFWEGDRNAFATLRHCLVETAKLLAPFTPFLADEIYATWSAETAAISAQAPDSVHLCDFPKPNPELVDDALEAAMEAVRRTVELGRAARAQAKAKVRQPLRKAVIVATESERAAIEAAGRPGEGGAERQGARLRQRAVRAGLLPGRAPTTGRSGRASES